MKTTLYSVDPSTTVGEDISLMAQNRIGSPLPRSLPLPPERGEGTRASPPITFSTALSSPVRLNSRAKIGGPRPSVVSCAPQKGAKEVEPLGSAGAEALPPVPAAVRRARRRLRDGTARQPCHGRIDPQNHPVHHRRAGHRSPAQSARPAGRPPGPHRAA